MCRPCAIGDPVVVSASLLADYTDEGLTADNNFTNVICQRVKTCLRAQQQQRVIVAASHFDIDGPVTELLPDHTVSAPDAVITISLQADVETQTLWTEMVYPEVGTYQVSILFKGRHVEQSPFFIVVEPTVCFKKNQEPNRSGNCVCTSKSLAFGDDCVDVLVLALPMAGLGVALVAAGLWLMLYCQWQGWGWHSWLQACG